jgi:hypothetical protein
MENAVKHPVKSRSNPFLRNQQKDSGNAGKNVLWQLAVLGSSDSGLNSLRFALLF